MTIPIFVPPLSVTYPQTRSPLWKTLHQEAVSGRDNPLQLWTYPRWRYMLPFSCLRTESTRLTQQYVLAFYNSLGGSNGVFQYTDPDDKTATNQTFAVGDGTTRTFQLVRIMTGTGSSFVEPVLAATPTQVTVNGVPTASYSNNDGGTVTFAIAPINGAVLRWTGTFNWLCRFDDDTIEFQKFLSTYWSVAKLPFTTIKL